MRDRISLAALMVAVVFGAALPVQAQQRYPIESSGEGMMSSRYTQQLAIDVEDFPGHQVRVVEIVRTYSDVTRLRVMGTRVSQSQLTALTDYVNGSGPARGYEIWDLADGERVFLQFDSITHSESTAAGSRRGISEAVTRIEGGTGKYKGVRGLLRSTVEFDTDPAQGFSRASTKGEYWFID